MISVTRVVACSVIGACLVFAPSNFAQQGTTVPASSTSEHGPIVEAPAGAAEGRVEGDLRVFKGIPFALPPVGEGRWRPPSPMPRWDGVKKAIDYGPACFQPKPQLSTLYAVNPMPMSEDCLTLNIWAPTGAHNAPVFFWIYGGALTGGASRDETYDGSRLAARASSLSPSTID